MQVLTLTLPIAVLGALCAAGVYSYGLWTRGTRPLSTETIVLTPEARSRLVALRAEQKFQAHDYPPLGYTGAARLQDELNPTAAVNGFIDDVLAGSNFSIAAADVRKNAFRHLARLERLDTEDRDRAYDYVLDVWYTLGFRGALTRIQPGSGFPIPDGYAEPLPAGWISPSQPRPIETIGQAGRLRG